MAFCGQCGLLLNPNTTKCPRCGTAPEIDAAMSGTPADNNGATIITHTNSSQPDSSIPYTPSPPSDTSKAGYYAAPEGSTSQSVNNYSMPGTFQPNGTQSGSNYMMPGAPSYQGQAPGMYQPGVFPGTDPGYQFQAPTPPRKKRRWPIVLVIVLIVALIAVTVMIFAVGSNAAIFTPTPQVTPTTPPVATTGPAEPTATPLPTQQAQAVITQYYEDINAHKYQNAYYLWVNNPDNYDHYMQGFAHTQHDDITLGDAVPQTDGTVQVNLTLQATEDVTGGGTQVNTYQGYYTVGQQADGSWKIINGQLS